MAHILIKKLNENAVIPSFSHPGDGAQDLVATSFTYNPKYDRFEYGVGFATSFSQKYRFRIVPRSSNTKTEAYIPNSVGLIDSNYRGEWMVIYKLRTPMHILFPGGASKEDIKSLMPYQIGDRIAQCYLEEVIPVEWELVSELDDTERGTDGGLIRDDKNFK